MLFPVAQRMTAILLGGCVVMMIVVVLSYRQLVASQLVPAVPVPHATSLSHVTRYAA
ncbi:unnamed protein product [Ixodes persulcatus]